MTVNLTLRDALVLHSTLNARLENLKAVSDGNYPTRQEDQVLLSKLAIAADPHWNV